MKHEVKNIQKYQKGTDY